MNDSEQLKNDQEELKGKLLELIDYMNSSEFSSLDAATKLILMNQRVGMEMYLNSLTQRIYGASNIKMDMMFPLLVMGMSSPFNEVTQQMQPCNVVSQQTK